MEETEDRRYRRSCGAFATGVVVVSAFMGDGRRAGLTVNSWSSVSLKPRLIQWCLGNDSARFAGFSAADLWGVTVLGADEEALAQRYVRVATEVFTAEESDLLAGVPVLKAGIAHFACRTYARHKAGDHVLIVGEVLDFTCKPGDALTYFRGHYGRAAEKI